MSCPDDCAASTCGDGVCDIGEDRACGSDCVSSMAPEVPSGWTCPSVFYGGREACDCECGAYDPDCDRPGIRLYGCFQGEQCGSGGRCEPGPTGTWNCPDEHFGSGDGCDCECGVWDPDCAEPSAMLFNCEHGLVCGMDGRCGPDMRPTGDAGCACTIGGGGSSSPSPLLIALVLALVFMRRRSITTRSTRHACYGTTS
jgi:MYXO-CTERM domain-containing protein